MPIKKIKLPNPWFLASLILLLIFAGLIAYDKSTTFRGNINLILGITEEQLPQGEPKEVGITVVTDKFFVNPPYDIDTKVQQLKDEMESELKVRTVDMNDEEGKMLISEYNLKSVPVLIFDENFGRTSFYKEVAPYFSAEKNHYLLRLQPFKFLELPNTEDAQTKGNSNANISLLVYSSFTCPYSGKVAPVFEQALSEYPDKIKYTYKHFDRGGIDMMISNAAECAGEQGKFWELHDYIYENQKTIFSEDIIERLQAHAGEMGLDMQQFDDCISSEKYFQTIENHTREAFAFSVSGTPGIFINDVFIAGAVDYDTIKSVIDSFNP